MQFSANLLATNKDKNVNQVAFTSLVCPDAHFSFLYETFNLNSFMTLY